MDMPHFRYHPQPLQTGSVVRSSEKCVHCNQKRGLIYVGPVYGERDLKGQICPWCIYDGSAHVDLGITYTDEAAVGGYGKWDTVPEEVLQEITCRTPGFTGWQQEEWWTHCSSAGMFLGRMGWEELQAFGEDAIEGIRLSVDMAPEQWSRVCQQLHKDEPPSAYLFRCSVCGRFGGYWDTD